LPERFLLKILSPLVSAGVLRSAKGSNGGYVLARDPNDVTLLEVIELLDGPLISEAGAVGYDGAARDRRMQAVCNQAVALLRERLSRVALAELAKGK
jgi:Rrf2 family protein